MARKVCPCEGSSTGFKREEQPELAGCVRDRTPDDQAHGLRIEFEQHDEDIELLKSELQLIAKRSESLLLSIKKQDAELRMQETELQKTKQWKAELEHELQKTEQWKAELEHELRLEVQKEQELLIERCDDVAPLVCSDQRHRHFAEYMDVRPHDSDFEDFCNSLCDCEESECIAARVRALLQRLPEFQKTGEQDQNLL